MIKALLNIYNAMRTINSEKNSNNKNRIIVQSSSIPSISLYGLDGFGLGQKF